MPGLIRVCGWGRRPVGRQAVRILGERQMARELNVLKVIDTTKLKKTHGKQLNPFEVIGKPAA